jgi:hypothetical protein
MAKCGYLKVHKDLKSPFLMSGCKVADGYGTMLVSLCINSPVTNTFWIESDQMSEALADIDFKV